MITGDAAKHSSALSQAFCKGSHHGLSLISTTNLRGADALYRSATVPSWTPIASKRTFMFNSVRRSKKTFIIALCNVVLGHFRQFPKELFTRMVKWKCHVCVDITFLSQVLKVGAFNRWKPQRRFDVFYKIISTFLSFFCDRILI